METTTETELQEQHHEPNMVLTQEAQYYLQQAGKWASFLAIMGFIGCGLILIAALFAGVIFSHINPGMPGVASTFISVIYIIIALIMFFVNYHLYLFGTRIKKGIAFINNDLITLATSSLRSFFKIKGVILITILIFYVLMIILVIAVGGSAIMQHYQNAHSI